MNDSLGLDKLVVVSPRFARSVSLARDAYRIDALEGYILTPIGRDVLRRLASALRGESTTRAWSITGPYGTGKSAFALLAAQLLSGEERVRQQARKFLAASDENLFERFFGAGGPISKKAGRLCPVLVTGCRQPLEKALAAGLAASLRAMVNRGRRPQILERLELIVAQPNPSGTAIVHLFVEANEYLDRFGSEAGGILLIIDELGKFLEYGAGNPEQGDVFILQELAEVSTRSARPFLFLTILHQALDRYTDHMNAGRRAEWAKVQGRFEDIAFEERSEQLLRLLSHAIRHEGEEGELKPLRRQAKALAQDAVGLGIRAGSMGAVELQECLASCYPLHPLTAMILGPLFRQLAQNERSLFAFLASSEPFGFQEFLREHTVKGGPYRLDRLYDYVMASLGPSLFAQHRGKLWAEVQSALDRLHDATKLEVSLAKSIGLLQALGPISGTSSSLGTLHAALKGAASHAEVEEAILSLSRRSVIVFRRHTDSYALWEGSDVDIDDRLQVARQSVERDQWLAPFLTREIPPQPLIARRNYFQTGTLRYFEVVYCDMGDFQADLFRSRLNDPSGDADGRVVLCLPRDADDREAMRGIVQSIQGANVLAALPQDVFDLQELCHELVCLRWVMAHTPELEADRTARRELHSRMAIGEQNLRSHLEWVFSPVNAGCAWYYRGQTVTLSSQRELNDLLSRACEEVYFATPRWRNELINRRSLSSSAAAARRNLIEAMIEHPMEEALGIRGTPPERSMYESILRASGLHRRHAGQWGFYPPGPKAEAAVVELWQAIDRFFAESEQTRQSVNRPFALLRQPPFGLKEGVLPVILAAALLHNNSKVALYEEGTFVSKLTPPVFERILRSAHGFEVQRWRVSGVRASVLRRYLALLSRSEGDGEGVPNLLDIVRPLLRLARQLPEYVTKTRHLSREAQAVLHAIRSARQPDRLLFDDLPIACGGQPFTAETKPSLDRVAAFFGAMKDALQELQQAYPRLLSDLELLIITAFRRSGPFHAVREELANQSRLILNIAVEARLKSFLMRAADDHCDDSVYLESIAALLAGKSPAVWNDQDRARFEVQLAAMARTFHHFHAIAFELERGGAALLNGDTRALRVSVTVPGEEELDRVVRIPHSRDDQARAAEAGIRQALAAAGVLEDPHLSVAILAQTVRGLLSCQAATEERDSLGSQHTTVDESCSPQTRLGGT
jgi:hypothetical protein